MGLNCALTNSQLRTTDTLCRIGGEEFAILLPHTNGDLALDIAERVRLSIRESSISYGQEAHTLKITVSIGITEFNEEDNAISDMLLRADQALYKAKDSGRDNSVLQLVN